VKEAREAVLDSHFMRLAAESAVDLARNINTGLRCTLFFSSHLLWLLSALTFLSSRHSRLFSWPRCRSYSPQDYLKRVAALIGGVP